MNITILTQYYPPETGAPQNRLSDLAKQLHNAGHQVTVLTAMPNYPQNEIQPAYNSATSRHLDGKSPSSTISEMEKCPPGFSTL